MPKINENYMTNPVALAALFHETYEILAPAIGYKTREDTRAFDPSSKNGKLMILTCAEIQRIINNASE